MVHRRVGRRNGPAEAMPEASSQTVPAFARVIATEVGPEGIDEVIRVAQQRLPEARRQRGFAGFYLLADRHAGWLMTISLWSSYDDVVAAEELAARLRAETAGQAGTATPDADIYQVAVQG